MKRVFLSYSSKNEQAVLSLEHDLKEIEIEVWIDTQLTGGQTWWNLILEGIRNCECFVFALSPDSLGSEACMREASYAEALGKPILPVLVEEVREKVMPNNLSTIHFVDYRNQDKKAFIALTKSLGTLPSPAPPPVPPPDPPPVPISYLSDLGRRIATTEALGLEEQTTLFHEAKNGLKNEDDVEDVRELLRALRKRRDLLASVAEDIDALFEGTKLRPGDSTTGILAKAVRPGAPERERTTMQPGTVVAVRDAATRITDLVTHTQRQGGCWEVRADEETRVVLTVDQGRCVARALYGSYIHFKGSKLKGMGWRQDLLEATGDAVAIVAVCLTLGLLLLDTRFRLQLRRKAATRTWNSAAGSDSTFEIAQTVVSALRMLAPTAQHYTLNEGAQQDHDASWRSYLSGR